MFSLFFILKTRIYFAVSLLIFILLFGVLGYHFISDYDWVEALYMTIITVSTVGFGEVRPADDVTKIFTIALILLSVFSFTYSISILTQYFTSANSIQRLNQKQMKKKVSKLSEHIIVCGYGKNGKQAVKKFQLRKKNFVVIEKNVDLSTEKNIPFIKGDATEEKILKDAGVECAKYLITALPNDADNLFIVLSSRQLNKDLIIVSRISNESSQSKLSMAGANYTVMPDKIGGDHMALLLTHPNLTRFLENITSTVDNHANLEELSMDDLPKEFNNKTIIELNLRQETGCNIIGYKTPLGNYIVNPDGDTRLEQNSKLVVLGRYEQIKKLNDLLHIKA